MVGKNDAINQSLSSLLDNEHSELDLRRVLKAAETDPEVEKTWASYHLSRQSLKKEITHTCSPDFLSGIQEAIADDVVPRRVGGTFVWQNYMGKAATAACFTFVFLIGANQWRNTTADGEEALASVDVSDRFESMAVVPSGFELPSLNARTVSSSPSNGMVTTRMARPDSMYQQAPLSLDLQEQLSRLMLKHAETASANGNMSVIPFTRVGSVKSAAQ